MRAAKTGKNNPNYGKKHSEGSRVLMCKNHTDVSKENNPMYGKKHSNKTRALMRENHPDNSGEKHGMYGKHHTTRDIFGENNPMYGKHHSKETRVLQSMQKQGEKSPTWKGGITPENQRVRASGRYRLWREAVFARDNWTCQKCGERGGNLQAHHIKAFSLYPELRFIIGNGMTLCVLCHTDEHKQNCIIN